MSDLNNNMDKIFREKLGSYRKDPPDEIWAAIRSETDKRRARKLIMVAWRVAAGIAIVITAGYSYYYFTRPEKQTITENLKAQKEIIIEQGAAVTDVPVENNIAPSKSGIVPGKTDKNIPFTGKQESIARSEPDENVKVIAGIREELIVEAKPEVMVEIEPKGKEDMLLSTGRDVDFTGLPFPVKSLEFKHDRIPEKRIKEANLQQYLNPSLEIPDEKTGRKDAWSISAQASPTYNYRDLSQGDASSITSLNKSESGKLSYAGGLQLGLKATERLSLFAGLMYSKMGFEIRNVQSYQADIQESFGEIIFQQPKNTTSLYSLSNSTGSISSARSQNNLFLNKNSANQYANSWFNSPAYLDNIPGILSGSDKIDQYFQFIELPFMLRYKLLNRKLKMNLLGGLSTNVLVGNRVVLVSGKDRSTIGETQGIRTINYSGNLGFGFDYDLGKNFLFTIEPQFKYYLNNINENISLSSRPYSIGMFTGIRYIF